MSADQPQTSEPELVNLSPRKFLIGSVVTALFILAWGSSAPIPRGVLAAEVLMTILLLFVLGSIRYRLDKNALTYGAGIVIVATFWTMWWPTSQLKMDISAEGVSVVGHFFAHHFLTLHGLDELFHADTMLFILGLTFFVGAIAQTRLLETISFAVLEKTKGDVPVTIGFIAFLVSFLSGILDGVSMIGLMIRTLVIILYLAKTSDEDVTFAVIVSTIITTVCGMWLAYGEPPNLIMKSNLHPLLDNAFFLKYCLPVALGSYVIVYMNIRKRLKGKKIEINKLDVLDLNTADLKFAQASFHGEVATSLEVVEDQKNELGSIHYSKVIQHIHQGASLGEALVKENVPPNIRLKMFAHFVSEEMAETIDRHYQDTQDGHIDDKTGFERIANLFRTIHASRVKAQIIGGLSFIPFIGGLIWHGIDHRIPLFVSSFSGFVVAILAIWPIKKMRGLALHEARVEYMEYLFLLPLFLSITLLQKVEFFDLMAQLIHRGVEIWGAIIVATLQFMGATVLSALLDNNIVADFAARAIKGFPVGLLHLFAMSQIAGYAAGGCWTHIGSAQSVVAYAFVTKEIDHRFTPFQWIKAMTPVIIEISILMLVIISVESWMHHL